MDLNRLLSLDRPASQGILNYYLAKHFQKKHYVLQILVGPKGWLRFSFSSFALGNLPLPPSASLKQK